VNIYVISTRIAVAYEETDAAVVGINLGLTA